MMETLRIRWQRFSPRERVLISIMLVLAALVLIWLAVLRPLSDGLSASIAQHGEALDRHARITAKVKAIRGTPNFRTGASAPAPLNVSIAQSANEAGFVLERNDPQGAERANVAIANARPATLLAWIAQMEADGIYADTLSVQSNEQNGVSLTATFKRAGK